MLVAIVSCLDVAAKMTTLVFNTSALQAMTHRLGTNYPNLQRVILSIRKYFLSIAHSTQPFRPLPHSQNFGKKLKKKSFEKKRKKKGEKNLPKSLIHITAHGKYQRGEKEKRDVNVCAYHKRLEIKKKRRKLENLFV